MNEWNIQPRATACEACQKEFADKETFHTLLFDEKQDYRRLDVCAECWQSQHADGARDRKGFISHWHSIYEVPVAPVDPIRKETAETLLRKLIELNDPKYGPAAFILAVMLERKRILKVKEQLRREGQRVFIYEQPRSGDLFTILDPNLQLNQLEEVQRDVAALLEHGLNPPGQIVEASAAAPAVEPSRPVQAGVPMDAAPVKVESDATVPTAG
jgi:hypothetical protein